MKSDVATDMHTPSVSDLVAQTRQLHLEKNAQRREERSRLADAEGNAGRQSLERAVAAIVAKLPPRGAITLDWSQALRLARLDAPSEGRLRELQTALRKQRVLAAFGDRVVSFARDTE